VAAIVVLECKCRNTFSHPLMKLDIDVK